MTTRSTLAAVAGAGLMAVLSAFAPAVAQESATTGRGPAQRGEGRQATREGSIDRGALESKDRTIIRLIEDLARTQVELEAERDARRQLEAALAADRPQDSPRGHAQDHSPGEDHHEHAEGIGAIEGDDERPGDGDRDRRRDREGPGEVEVAEARVEAARAGLEAAEVRLDVARSRLELIERRLATGTIPETERFEGSVAVVEAQAHRAEARARLVEAEFHLAEVRRESEGDDREADASEGDDREGDDHEGDDHEGESDASEDVEDGDGIEVEDVLDTADRIIDLIRHFDDRPEADDDDRDRDDRDRDDRDEDDRDRDDRDRDDREARTRRDAVDEVIDTADEIIGLIQRLRRDR